MDTTYSITIPTILPDRRRSLADLLSQLAYLCPDVPIAVSPHVDGPRGRDTLEALNRGAAFGCTWTLHIEDDAFLAPDFDAVVRERLAEAAAHDHCAVNFYSDNRRVLRAMAEGRSSCPLPARYLWATVCIAVWTQDVPAITDFAPTWYDTHPEHWHASDLLLRSFYTATSRTVLLAVPSPAQHRNLGTTLRHTSRRRRYSRSFAAAYGPCPR